MTMAPLTRARRARPPALVVLAALAPLALSLALVPASSALATWATHGSGTATGAASVMPTGSTPAGTVAGSSVTVSWPASTLPGGAPVGGYIVNRFDAVNGAPATVGSGCSGVVANTTCTEQSVPAGSWEYTVTPVQLNWTGGESPDSAAVVVP
jgi:hypothetical protein